MKKIIIFDFDGVLVLSTAVGINTLIKAIRSCDLNEPTFDDVRLMWGLRLEAELIPLLSLKFNWPSGGDKQVINSFLELSDDVAYPFQEGLVETLESLVSRGYQLGIVTNRDTKSLMSRLAQNRIKFNLFRLIKTADAGFNKPDCRVFHYFWHGLDILPKEAIFVGDSILYDFETARLHSPPLAFVGITSGLHAREEFLQVGVPETHIFNNVIEIAKVINSL